MHDELGQALTALKMDLSWLSKKLPKGQESLAEKTTSMLKLVNNTVKAVKRISTGLRPGLLDDLGLVAALEWQAGEFQARTGIKTGLSFKPDDIMVDNERATALFRIFQEVLTNVARHAAATRIDASLRNKSGVLELSMSDNGKGIGQKMINSSKSLGLIGMRERCHHLGGTIGIMGKPGEGTTVTVNLPDGKASNDKNTGS
jgi:signal transduction histidine kinase